MNVCSRKMSKETNHPATGENNCYYVINKSHSRDILIEYCASCYKVL